MKFLFYIYLVKGKKKMKPIFIENSKVPVALSKIAPINIWAINLIFFVFCKGKLNETTKRHETIHFRQWLELGIVGFAFLYPVFYLWNRVVKRMPGSTAYYNIPFEIEAYQNQDDVDYLESRKLWAWRRTNENKAS